MNDGAMRREIDRLAKIVKI